MVRELTGEQVAQHLGDRDRALKGLDLDAATQLGGDVDRQPRGEPIGLRAVLRNGRFRRPDPGVRITWPRHESAFGIAARHRAILSISAASAAISRAANSLRRTPDTSRPLPAASPE